MTGNGIEKFVDYVNKNVGKPLTTGVISAKTKVHVRRVQSFCKVVRENTRKVAWGTVGGRSITYTFKKPISVKDCE